MMKQRTTLLVALAIISIFSLILVFLEQSKPPTWPTNSATNKVVILGFDGIEHTLLEKWMAEGKLPNFKKLSEEGTYSTLATTTPAQSPVAWSSFATGTNPGKHDVMDFIIRDPDSYNPGIGMIETSNPFIGKPKITNKQKGESFWDILSKNGIKSKIIKVPVTFPAKAMNGQLLTGLGTPDALGTIGTFQYFTTEKTAYKDNDQAYNLVTLDNNNELKARIKGPKNTSTNLSISRSPKSITLSVGGKVTTLGVNEWSEYVNIDFNLLGPLYKEHGIAKFYLEESKPELKLYMSPVSFDPKKPFYDISYPKDYANQLATEIGLFKTLGFSTDLWALKEERITEDIFLEDINQTLEEEKKILKNELKKNDWNTYVQVFQATDLVQHMFFRYIDPEGPRYEANSKYQNTILETYQKMDKIIEETAATMPKDTTLIVMSDHGFKPYRKSVDLNSWLYENGYLALKDPSKRGDFLNNVAKPESFWDIIDWSKTKAYGLGLGSLYINQSGREGKGIVTEEEYTKLRNEIRDKLLLLKDNGKPVVSSVYKREEIMHGQYLADAADLIVGFAEGYRISWQTTFGTVPTKTIFSNDNKFSGDHCSVDPPLIPGIFLSNKKVVGENFSIMDIAPLVLKEFNIEIPANMDGSTNVKVQ